MQKQEKEGLIWVVVYQLYGNMHMRCDASSNPP